MKVQESIDLSAAPEQVWPYLFEPEKVLRWCLTYQEYVYATGQHSGLGTRFDIVEKAGGPVMKYTFEITQWEAESQTYPENDPGYRREGLPADPASRKNGEGLSFHVQRGCGIADGFSGQDHRITRRGDVAFHFAEDAS